MTGLRGLMAPDRPEETGMRLLRRDDGMARLRTSGPTARHGQAAVHGALTRLRAIRAVEEAR